MLLTLQGHVEAWCSVSYSPFSRSTAIMCHHVIKHGSAKEIAACCKVMSVTIKLPRKRWRRVRFLLLSFLMPFHFRIYTFPGGSNKHSCSNLPTECCRIRHTRHVCRNYATPRKGSIMKNSIRSRRVERPCSKIVHIVCTHRHVWCASSSSRPTRPKGVTCIRGTTRYIHLYRYCCIRLGSA